MIHAHPSAVTILTLAGGNLIVEALPKSLYSLQKVPTVSYATPGSA
ncbi:hypothetical protein DFAR_340044 [Desulfarculales bacterium]